MYSLPQSYNQTSKCKRCISSNAYQKEGYLTINVDPQIEDRIETIEVHDKSKLKPDEVTIEAKIIEK